ncbi:hypothetical protein Btru_020270 [Bulinus truncatus]|nr:hypothetical protein Btru_020270 [Bulinus truncatus]
MFKNSGQDSGYEDEQNDLHLLCQTGSLGEIITFLQSSPRGTKLHWYYEGQTALHTATLSGRSDTCDVIGCLLDHGADINAQTVVDSNTALHLVVLYGVFPRDVDTIVFFLQRKADLTIRNKKLRTPYDCAIASGNYELAGILNGSVPPDKAKELYIIRCRQKYGPEVIKAILENNETKLRNSLQLGGDPNTLNKHGAGAIHYTVMQCKLPVYDTLLALLESGADVNLRDEIKGDTALNLVIKNNKLHESGVMVKCVHLLIDWGAQPDIKDVDGKDAHQLALEKKYTDVATVLKKKPKKISKSKTERKKNVVFKEINLEISDVSKTEHNVKPPTPEVPVEKPPTPAPEVTEEVTEEKPPTPLPLVQEGRDVQSRTDKKGAEKSSAAKIQAKKTKRREKQKSAKPTRGGQCRDK